MNHEQLIEDGWELIRECPDCGVSRWKRENEALWQNVDVLKVGQCEACTEYGRQEREKAAEEWHQKHEREILDVILGGSSTDGNSGS